MTDVYEQGLNFPVINILSGYDVQDESMVGNVTELQLYIQIVYKTQIENSI